MTAATLAIAGIFPFAGFFSKDAILYEAFASSSGGKLLWAAGLVTAFLTAFYMFRLWYLTFFGERRESSDHAHPHESPWSMLIPLVLLAALSVVGGWIGWPHALGGSDHFSAFLAPVFADVPAMPAPEVAAGGHLELILAIVSTLVALSGWLLADLFYRRRPGLPAALATKAAGVYRLLSGKYWIDELYAATIVRPLEAGSETVLYRGVDNTLVDGATHSIAEGALGAGGVVRRMQSGNIRSYAGWIAIGGAALLILAIEVAR